VGVARRRFYGAGGLDLDLADTALVSVIINYESKHATRGVSLASLRGAPGPDSARFDVNIEAVFGGGHGSLDHVLNVAQGERLKHHAIVGRRQGTQLDHALVGRTVERTGGLGVKQ
jgi:hypothetical protein